MTRSCNLDASVSSAFELGLPRDSIYRVADASAVRITVRRGTVWITLDNDPVDIVLGAGEQFSTRQHRRALVSALENACLSVRPGAVAHGRARGDATACAGAAAARFPAGLSNARRGRLRDGAG